MNCLIASLPFVWPQWICSPPQISLENLCMKPPIVIKPADSFIKCGRFPSFSPPRFPWHWSDGRVWALERSCFPGSMKLQQHLTSCCPSTEEPTLFIAILQHVVRFHITSLSYSCPATVWRPVSPGCANHLSLVVVTVWRFPVWCMSRFPLSHHTSPMEAVNLGWKLLLSLFLIDYWSDSFPRWSRFEGELPGCVMPGMTLAFFHGWGEGGRVCQWLFPWSWRCWGPVIVLKCSWWLIATASPTPEMVLGPQQWLPHINRQFLVPSARYHYLTSAPSDLHDVPVTSSHVPLRWLMVPLLLPL